MKPIRGPIQWICIMIFSLFLPSLAFSGNNNATTDVSVSLVRTDLDREAVALQIQEEVIDGLYFADKINLNKLTPTIDILSGGDDAFQSVIVKFNGHKVFMSQMYDTDIAGKRSCS